MSQTDDILDAGLFYATMESPGPTPRWRRLYLNNVVITQVWDRPGAEPTLTIYDELPRLVVPVVSLSWLKRRHAVRSEYARRRRRRSR